MLIILIIYFIQVLHDDLPQVFIETIGFTVEIISKDIILRDSCGMFFVCKNFSKVSSERVLIPIVYEILGHILEVLFHYFFVYVFSISNVEISTSFTCDFVNNAASATLTFVYTYNIYFSSLVAVALSMDKVFQC